MRYVGDFAAVEGHGVLLTCDKCQVYWTGCADEHCCPVCEEPQDHWLFEAFFEEIDE